MLKAQIHGKLPSDTWQNNEDPLTSAVLGTLANLPADVSLRVLADVVTLEAGPPFELKPPLTWQFWPWWANPMADPAGQRCHPA
jgi:hypothetical protein